VGQVAESDFDDLMPHTVTVNAFSAYSEDGVVSYSTSASSYKARVIEKDALLQLEDGSEKMSRARAYVNSTSAIDPKDKVTLPDGTFPSILRADLIPDEDGAHHVVLWFGRITG
jgi:hypothetical protein